MARNFKIIHDFGERAPYTAGEDISEGDMVTLSGGTLAEVADTNTVGAYGVACADIASGDDGWIYTGGIFTGDAKSGVDFTEGELVYNSAAAELDAGTGGDVPVGKVVAPEPSSGGTVYFELWSLSRNEIDAQ